MPRSRPPRRARRLCATGISSTCFGAATTPPRSNSSPNATSPRSTGFAWPCCATRPTAQDVAQESLIRVWKALPGYDGRAALSTWIYAITRNRCLTALERARVPLSLSDEAVQAEAEEVAAANADADSVSTLRRLVDELPEAARRVITLFYFEERSVAEVAAMLGHPEGTVKTHLFRARAALLEKLSGLGLADPALWTT